MLKIYSLPRSLSPFMAHNPRREYSVYRRDLSDSEKGVCMSVAIGFQLSVLKVIVSNGDISGTFCITSNYVSLRLEHTLASYYTRLILNITRLQPGYLAMLMIPDLCFVLVEWEVTTLKALSRLKYLSPYQPVDLRQKDHELTPEDDAVRNSQTVLCKSSCPFVAFLNYTPNTRP